MCLSFMWTPLCDKTTLMAFFIQEMAEIPVPIEPLMTFEMLI